MYQTNHYTSINPGGDEMRGGFKSQYTIQYSFMNHEASVDGYGRGGYMSHTSHYTSHNPGGCGRMSVCCVASRTVHGNRIGDWINDNGRCGYRSQETRHCL